MKKAALLLGLFGAVLLSLNLGVTVLAYSIMLASAILWVITLRKVEREAALLNFGFAVINIIGIVRAI